MDYHAALEEVFRAVSGEEVELDVTHLRVLVDYLKVPLFLVHEFAHRTQDRDLLEALSVLYVGGGEVSPRHLLAVIRCAEEFSRSLSRVRPVWARPPAPERKPRQKSSRVQRERIGPVTEEEVLAWIWILQSMTGGEE